MRRWRRGDVQRGRRKNFCPAKSNILCRASRMPPPFAQLFLFLASAIATAASAAMSSDLRTPRRPFCSAEHSLDLSG